MELAERANEWFSEHVRVGGWRKPRWRKGGDGRREVLETLIRMLEVAYQEGRTDEAQDRL